MTTSSQTQPDPEKSSNDILEVSYESLSETVAPVKVSNGIMATNSTPIQGMVVAESEDVETEQATAAPQFYRGVMDGSNAFPDDHYLDAAVLHYEYDRRRRGWWEARRWFIYVLTVLAPLLLLVGLVGLIIKAGFAGLLLIGGVVCLVLLLLVLAYSWWTLPRVMSFGRVYRRFVTVPLDRGGLVWNDPVKAVPDFPALRDNFFALYRDSDDLGSKIQPNDDEETDRKKRTLNDLNSLIAPLKNSAVAQSSTPYLEASHALALDKLWLQPLSPNELAATSSRTVPAHPQPGQTQKLEQLAHEVEDYSGLDELQSNVEPGWNGQQPSTIHNQIAGKVAQNLAMVAGELGRWQERSEREKAFNTGLLAHYDEAVSAVKQGYSVVETALEAEIRPAVQRLEAETAFYRSQVQRYYVGQTEVIENNRDGALAKLEQEHHDLENNQEERLDEQRLLQAELKGLNDQRFRLDNSTNSRFEGLKSQLSDLTDRTYNLPPTPHFRSDLASQPMTGDSEETLRLLAQLRADTRLATSAVNNALNRYARLRFEPLDELGRLRQQIAAGTKWQATAWLGNLINFRQSGQLLALAGEVGDSVGVYLDSINEFERLNNLWCGLESSIRELGLTTYNNQLAEAQRYLEGLEQALTSLHSSLSRAPHSPEMARPSTFQNLYDLAAGLQRELDELGGLAGSIARTQERLSELDAELSQLTGMIEENINETEMVRQEASNRLADVQRKQMGLLAKLDELKTARLQKIRAHIIAHNQTRDTEIAKLETGSNAFQELGDVAGKILQKHLRQSQNLLDEANALRKGLEETIASIVKDFERGTQADRCLRTTSEVFVPAWYFQLSERPIWRKKIIGFASCYSSIRLSDPPVNSVWRFALTNRPATFYQLEEDTALETLIQADSMEYPAGEVEIPGDTPDWLVNNSWVSPWLVKLHRVKR